MRDTVFRCSSKPPRPRGRFLCSGYPPSVHFLDVAGLPRLIEGRLLRAIKSQDHEEALIGHRLKPVLAFARRGGTEIDVGRAVRICYRSIHRVERWKRLSIVESRAGDRVIDRNGPEQCGWNIF